MERKIYDQYIQILKEELVPAMGCTEPVALAYGAAVARAAAGTMPDRVEVQASNNIIKNVKSVVVPNTGGMKGIEAAVAAGIAAGDETKTLEVISSVSEQQIPEIRKFRENVPIRVLALEGPSTFDVILTLYAKEDCVKLRIKDHHTNIVSIEKNGKDIMHTVMKKHNCVETAGERLADRDVLNVETIIKFADELDPEDVKEIFDRQISYNMKIAQEGLDHEYGANVGSTWMKSYGNDVRNRAIAKAAAGSDARMSGCELPVVINSGSGNQGITVSVPVIEYAREKGASMEELYRALAVSNLTAIHEKSGIGRLSAYCGAVSAGCAAACGISYLYGGRLKEIAHTLVNSVVITSGMICDGAKPSCAGKIAISVMSGILGYHMYENGGQQFRCGDGIVDRNVEETIKNVGRVGKDGMRQTDQEIVKIMIRD